MRSFMQKIRPVAKPLVALLLLVLGAGVAAAAPSITAIRHGVRGEQIRVVIDLNAKPDYEVFDVENPDRIAINLKGTRISSAVRPLDIGDGFVRRIRINKLSWGTQIVLDLSGGASWEEFYLAPAFDMPSRIVLDVVPSSRGAFKPVKSSVAARAVDQPLVVAIDAGHGGHDPGARGNGIVEKDAALDIARRIARLVEAQRMYRAVLVRDRDVFLDLDERMQIARSRGADVFVSVHLNSAPKRGARGAEVFFLSPAGAQSTAKKVLSSKSTAEKELGVSGASSEILHMLVDVNQQAMMERSSLLAEEILKSLRRPDIPPPRSVKQKSFVVLKSIDVPSVMVETGFLTNSGDASVFKSSRGREEIAKGIANGVFSFFQKYPPPSDQRGRLVVHKVRSGDTLWQLSQKYNTSVASIQQSNKLGSSKTIRVGQELVIRAQ